MNSEKQYEQARLEAEEAAAKLVEELDGEGWDIIRKPSPDGWVYGVLRGNVEVWPRLPVLFEPPDDWAEGDGIPVGFGPQHIQYRAVFRPLYTRIAVDPNDAPNEAVRQCLAEARRTMTPTRSRQNRRRPTERHSISAPDRSTTPPLLCVCGWRSAAT